MLNVDANEFRSYLEVFHRTYIEAVEMHIDSDWRGFLDRYPRLPTRIEGHVSTTLGVAYEYVEGDEGIEVKHSSQRVEFIRVGGEARR